MPKTTFNFEQTADGGLKVTANCIVTNKPYEVKLNKEQAIGFIKWKKHNVSIQDAMPTVSADNREFLISGTSPEGWNLLFAEQEHC